MKTTLLCAALVGALAFASASSALAQSATANQDWKGNWGFRSADNRQVDSNVAVTQLQAKTGGFGTGNIYSTTNHYGTETSTSNFNGPVTSTSSGSTNIDQQNSTSSSIMGSNITSTMLTRTDQSNAGATQTAQSGVFNGVQR